MRFCNGAEAATSCITFAVAKAAPPWLLEATPQALRPSRMLEVLGVLVIASLRAQNISWSCALILFVLRRAIQTQACARGNSLHVLPAVNRDSKICLRKSGILRSSKARTVYTSAPRGELALDVPYCRRRQMD